MISPVTDTQTHTHKTSQTYWWWNCLIVLIKMSQTAMFFKPTGHCYWGMVGFVLFCLYSLNFLIFFLWKLNSDKSLKSSWHGRKPYDYKDTVGILGIGWQIFLFICSCWYPSVSQFASKCKEMNTVICDNCQSHHLYGSLTILVFITLFRKKNL